MIYEALRRAGFLLDPESAHRLALLAASRASPVSRLRARRHRSRPVEAFGLTFGNPLGLAAGYDKNGTAWRGLAALGFGHIEIGTVTPRPQPGNPRPRIERLRSEQALVNRLGFPSDGAAAVARRIGERRRPGVVLGVSVGPNATTSEEGRLADYRRLVDAFAGIADYLAVNVSSPNTEGLRDLERPDRLGELIEALVGHRDHVAAEGPKVPLLVKLSPDPEDLVGAVRAAVAAGADGLIVGNTTLQRSGPTAGLPPGGLSGRPLAPLALDALRRVLEATDLPVIACGGVMSAADAEERLLLGACLVQVYTGLVYRGPRLIHEVLD